MRNEIFKAHTDYKKEWQEAWCKYALKLCPEYLDGSKILKKPTLVAVTNKITFSEDIMNATEENELIYQTTVYTCRFSRIDKYSVTFFISILPYYRKNFIFYFKNDKNLVTPNNLKLYAFASVDFEEFVKYYTPSK